MLSGLLNMEGTAINFYGSYLYHLDLSNWPKLVEVNVNDMDIEELDSTSPLSCKTIIFVFFDGLLIFAIGTL